MVVDFLGPLLGIAPTVALPINRWFEPLEAFYFLALGANGFWQNSGQNRCTSSVIDTTASGERAPYA